MEETIEKIVLSIGLKRIYRVFKVIRSFYMLIDFFLSTTIGYSLVHGWTEDQLKANHYHSGHLVRILGRGTANPASHVFLDNFILRHEAYINPIYFVMNNDHVTLMGASKTHVWFSVSPNYDVYTIGKIPFAFLAQYLKCKLAGSE